MDDIPLLLYGTLNSLANVPYGILHETDSFLRFPFAGSKHQGKITLTYEVVKSKTVILILTGNAHHKSEICGDKLVECLLISLRDTLTKHTLFLIRKTRLIIVTCIHYN